LGWFRWPEKLEFWGRKPSSSVLVGVIHAIGILDAGDLVGEMLDFEICLQNLDMQQLAFFGVTAVGASTVEGEIPIMRLYESLHQSIHEQILFRASPSSYWAKTLVPYLL
jgi:hypothetical protein